MFTVGNMRRALAGLDDEQPLAVVFFTKSDAEDNTHLELTNEQWEFACTLFHKDAYVDHQATEAIYEYTKQAIRAKASA